MCLSSEARIESFEARIESFRSRSCQACESVFICGVYMWLSFSFLAAEARLYLRGNCAARRSGGRGEARQGLHYTLRTTSVSEISLLLQIGCDFPSRSLAGDSDAWTGASRHHSLPSCARVRLLGRRSYLCIKGDQFCNISRVAPHSNFPHAPDRCTPKLFPPTKKWANSSSL